MKMKGERLVADRRRSSRTVKCNWTPEEWKALDDVFADARRALESYITELENREVRLEP